MSETGTDCIHCNRSHGEEVEGGFYKRSRWACEERVGALEGRIERLEEHLKIGETKSGVGGE